MANTHPNPAAPQQKRRFGPGRSILRTAAFDRGRRTHNLWYHYSARLRRDVILRSDAEFSHFCWVEADPTVLRYELEPAPVAVVIDNDVHRTQFDAFVEFRAAAPELREIKTSDVELDERERRQKLAQEAAAANAGFRYVRITHSTLAAHSQLIGNWRCALAHQAACREVLLTPFENELLDIARDRRECSLDELLRPTNPDLRPKYLAALFGALQEAKLSSDIAVKPLCAATRIKALEVGHE